MKNHVDVLMVGSSTEVKGGMSTVVQSFLKCRFAAPIKLDYIATHTEKGDFYNLLFFGKSLVQILFYLIWKNPRIVHMHMSERGSFIRKYIIFNLAKTFRKKVIVHTHGAEFKEYYLNASPFIKKRISHLLRNADKVIVLGDSWAKTLEEIEPKINIAVLLNSVPIPIVEKASSEKTTFTILFLAVLIQRKGIMDLIEASVPVIREAHRQNKHIVFEIAGDGELMELTKQQVARHGVKSSFQFHGWVGEQQKIELLKKADLFVLPSYNEGLPVSILEALSYGIPVISTRVGSINEAVKEEENGYLIEPGDINALAEKMLAIMCSSDSYHMRLASRKLAEEKFSDEQYFRKMENLYLYEI
ncbi:glycosyltransferase family 4 protein [Planococcus shenhongbingii]|uniref:Glycosyltransferase family 4 protein n=1 Tax=Planococcus shenhongbingii TaxID=3058398 RepID=A0ABT8NA00_9BACL|nr:glycosyltransferase family 4 protein [Planococcus sp. N017]MDN7244583.1 glycosyltransferase family 4 protein [Planococcus sp. N017]